MTVSVSVVTVHPRWLAAVRHQVTPGEVGSAWGPAVGKVWDFIRSQPGLWIDGHNIFLYHHSDRPGAPILCDFGVEVTRTFETAGEVYATETPGGEAAVAVHRGPYERMYEAYNAIDEWMAANRRESAGQSWEIYGDPTPDPADSETTVVHPPSPPADQVASDKEVTHFSRRRFPRGLTRAAVPGVAWVGTNFPAGEGWCVADDRGRR